MHVCDLRYYGQDWINSTNKSILDVLKAIKLRSRKTIVQGMELQLQ